MPKYIFRKRRGGNRKRGRIMFEVTKIGKANIIFTNKANINIMFEIKRRRKGRGKTNNRIYSKRRRSKKRKDRWYGKITKKEKRRMRRRRKENRESTNQ